MVYTSQQAEAIRLFQKFIASPSEQIFILKGFAGTGKTTLIVSLVKILKEVQLATQVMAPTGKAAKILSEKLQSTNIQPSTIHRGIYQFEKMVIDDTADVFEYHFPLRDNDTSMVCVVDEASMISSMKANEETLKFGSGCLLDDLLNYSKVDSGGKIVFVGDPMQLPPVSDSRSCALDASFFEERNYRVVSYELTDVVRQAEESSLLENAGVLRELMEKNVRNALKFKKRKGEFEDIPAVEVCEKYIKSKSDSAIICYSNHLAADYNDSIRALLFPGMEHVSVGDRLMVVSNNYKGYIELFNGDMISVTDVAKQPVRQSAPVWVKNGDKKERVNISLDFRKISFTDAAGISHTRYILETLLENRQPRLTRNQMKAMYINLMIRLRNEHNVDMNDKQKVADAIMNDDFYNALHVKYGYAFTCHKSQGSEWEEIFVDFSKRTGLDDDSMRWKYTAITRAKKMVWCVNLPDISPLMSLSVRAITKSSKVPSNALSFKLVKDTPFHVGTDDLCVKVKYWSIVKNLNGTDYRLKNVIHKPYRERYSIEGTDGINIVDCLYNKAGIFTRYEFEKPDETLYTLLKNEENIVFEFQYHSAFEALNILYQRILSLCDELGIILTNVYESDYKVFYYMRTSGEFASLTFFYNAKGFINYAAPLSDMGAADEKLQLLIEKLK